MDADDVEAIRRLVFTYTFRLDRGDFDGVAELLAEAVLSLHGPGSSGREVRGRDEVRDFYAGQVITYDGDPRTRHLISNLLVTADGEEGAQAFSYFTVQQRPPGRTLEVIMGGHYEDRFARTEDGWRFVAKQIHADHINDVSAHFRPTS